MNALLVVAVVPLLTLLSAVTTHLLTRSERREGWRRADQLAARVEVVHDLVNSERTAAVVRELASTRRELVSLQQIAELHRLAGHEPKAEALEAITATETTIDALEQALAKRREQEAAQIRATAEAVERAS